MWVPVIRPLVTLMASLTLLSEANAEMTTPTSRETSAPISSSSMRTSNMYGDAYGDEGDYPQYLIVREEDSKGNTLTIKAECDVEDMPYHASSVSKKVILYDYIMVVVENNKNPVELARDIEMNLAKILWGKLLNNCQYGSSGWGKTLQYLAVGTDPADYVSKNCHRRYRWSGSNCYVIAAGLSVEYFYVNINSSGKDSSGERYNDGYRGGDDYSGGDYSGGAYNFGDGGYRRHLKRSSSMVEHEMYQMLSDLYASGALVDGVEGVSSLDFMGYTSASLWRGVTSNVGSYAAPVLWSVLTVGTVCLLLMNRHRLGFVKSLSPKLDLDGFYKEAPDAATPGGYAPSPGLDTGRKSDFHAIRLGPTSAASSTKTESRRSQSPLPQDDFVDSFFNTRNVPTLGDSISEPISELT